MLVTLVDHLKVFNFKIQVQMKHFLILFFTEYDLIYI